MEEKGGKGGSFLKLDMRVGLILYKSYENPLYLLNMTTIRYTNSWCPLCAKPGDTSIMTEICM